RREGTFMLLSSSVVRLGLLTASFVVAAACGDSCCCDPADPKCQPPPVEHHPSIAFASTPLTVNCADDVDTDTDGVQIDVRVAVVDNDGSITSVTVTSDRNDERPSANFDDNDEATVRVTLVGGADPGAENNLTATANDDSL